MPKRDPTLAAFGRNVARIRAERGFSRKKPAEKADFANAYRGGSRRGHDVTHRPYTAWRVWVSITHLFMQ
jgi:hypothetical protein